MGLLSLGLPAVSQSQSFSFSLWCAASFHIISSNTPVWFQITLHVFNFRRSSGPSLGISYQLWYYPALNLGQMEVNGMSVKRKEFLMLVQAASISVLFTHKRKQVVQPMRKLLHWSESSNLDSAENINNMYPICHLYLWGRVRSGNWERANSHAGAACSVLNYLLDTWLLANIANNLHLSLWNPKRKCLHSWQDKK